MKRNFSFIVGVLSIGLISGCSVNESANGGQFETKVAAETNDTNLDKKWKDVTENLSSTHEIKSVTEMISSFDRTIHQDPQQKLLDAGFVGEYNSYLEAQALLNTMQYIKVKGEAMEKDLSNAKQLAQIINEQNHWKDPSAISEKTLKSISYLQQLLNDLDITVNGKEGKLSGFSYQAGGDKTGELEAFLKSSK